MRAVIFAGGPGIAPDRAASIASECDIILAADGGADIACASGVMPQKVIGDLDSIDPQTVDFLKHKCVPLEQFPTEKDMTDSELCLNEVPDEAEVILICSLSGRPDHVLSNMMMAVKAHAEGRDITLTDGVNDFIPLCGPDEISISGIQNPEDLAISLIPFTEVKGVTSEGLYYKLDDTDLIPGSSLSVSNKVEQGSDSFVIHVNSGKMGVLIVPAD
jgi:thiamine pyrophosphokinase